MTELVRVPFRDAGLVACLDDRLSVGADLIALPRLPPGFPRPCLFLPHRRLAVLAALGPDCLHARLGREEEGVQGGREERLDDLLRFGADGDDTSMIAPGRLVGAVRLLAAGTV